MTRFKEIDDLLEKWKAARDNAYANFDWRVKGTYAKCVSDLETALEILKRPSNKVDADRSAECQQCGYDCDRDREYKLSCIDYKPVADD